jgi:hypothetical protein
MFGAARVLQWWYQRDCPTPKGDGKQLRYYYSKSNEIKRNAKKRIHLRQFWHRMNARKKRVQKGERKGRAR